MQSRLQLRALLDGHAFARTDEPAGEQQPRDTGAVRWLACEANSKALTLRIRIKGGLERELSGRRCL
jgi:hypothetical protein